jgi:AcrR family transcriptional regulator
VTRLRAKLLDDVGRAVGRGHARSQLLAAAIDLFAERGVAATRVEDVLVAARLSRRTFYQHFDDKQAVVRAIYELVTRHLAAAFAEASAGAGDPKSAIARILDVYLEVHRTDRDIVRALIEDSLRPDSVLFRMRAQFRGQITATLDAIVAMVTGRRIEPLVSLALVSALEGLSLELLANEITDDDVARTRAVITSLIGLVLEHPEGVPARSR